MFNHKESTMFKTRNPVGHALARMRSGCGRHKDKRRPVRSQLKAALRKEYI